jgi:hypothetical protein
VTKIHFADMNQASHNLDQLRVKTSVSGHVVEFFEQCLALTQIGVN